MSFQSGTHNLTNGVQDYTVTFPAAFSTTPGVIIPVVFNTTDSSVLMINAQVTAKSASQFSVHLDAVPDSNNYVLGWMAGTAAVIYAALLMIGKKVTDIAVTATLPVDADLFPFVAMSPLPTSKVVTWEMIRSAFVNYLADPPAAADSEGITGQFAADENFLYFRLETTWIQVPVLAGDWLTENPLKPEREGVVSLTSGQATKVVTFGTPFASGNAPIVEVQVFNVESGDKLVLYAMPIASSLSGFTVALNAAPDSSDYKMHYRARQLT